VFEGLFAKVLVLILHGKGLVVTGVLLTGVVITGTVGTQAVILVMAPPAAAAVEYPTDPLVHIDDPRLGAHVSGTVEVKGWAVDRNSKDNDGPGIERVSIYLDRIANDSKLGDATLGLNRPEVAETLEEPRFLTAGWTFSWNAGTLEGNHTLYVLARAKKGARLSLASREVNDPLVRFDSPANGATVRQNDLVGIMGWAIDRSDLEGDGIQSVTLYLDDKAHLLGIATPDQESADIADRYGDRFGNSGWTFNWEVGETSVGEHVLIAVALSSVSGHETTVTRDIEVKDDVEDEATGPGCSEWAHQRNEAWHTVHGYWQTARSEMQGLRKDGPSKGGKGSAQAVINSGRSSIDSTVRTAHREIQAYAHSHKCQFGPAMEAAYTEIVDEAKAEMETAVEAAKLAVALLPVETSQKGKGNQGKGRP
jgi:hypothetical protein